MSILPGREPTSVEQVAGRAPGNLSRCAPSAPLMVQTPPLSATHRCQRDVSRLKNKIYRVCQMSRGGGGSAEDQRVTRRPQPREHVVAVLGAAGLELQGDL